MARNQKSDKRKILVELAKMPIVEIALQRVGVPRATYYRWLKDDPEFSESAQEALDQSIGFVNDMAESKVIEGIKAGITIYVFYWLNNRHPVYRIPSYKHNPDEFEERRQYRELTEELETKMRAFLDDVDNLPDDSPKKLNRDN